MAKFKHDFEVCQCRKVSLGEIIHAIKEKSAKTLQDLENTTDAGSACGCCKSSADDYGNPKMELYLEQILNKFVSRVVNE